MRKSPKQLLVPTRPHPDSYPTNNGLVEAAFITIRSGLSGFAHSSGLEVEEKDMTLSEYTSVRKGRNFHNMGLTALKDGFVLDNVTKSSFVNFSHRLKFPLTGDPDYFRTAYNIDSQCVRPSDINLTGIKEISKNPEATISVLMFERDVVYGALTNWAGFKK